jgi:hypothetical protein
MDESEKQENKAKKEKTEGSLRKLKQEYELLKVKYNFPEFKYMNDNFEIENIDSSETELFIKQIRKHMTEKIFYILRTLETFINPQNAPLFIFNIIKLFSEADKESIQELYKKLGKYEIEAFGLEAVYDEKKEAEFVRKLAEDWKEISSDLNKLYVSMKANHDKDGKKSSKSYFG